MSKKKPKLQFRYYVMNPNSQVLPLLGDEWRRCYGEGIEELHFHNYMEIGICHEGHGKSILGEREIPFQGGCFLIVPPDYPHTNNSDPGTISFWEWMYFDIESILQDIKNLINSCLDLEEIQDILYQSPFLFYREEYWEISEVIMGIRRECDARKPMYQEKIRGLLQVFVVELLRMNNVHEKETKKSTRSVLINPALNYVRKHYSEDIRIGDLADVCGMSESHFRRIFQECMNMIPNDYVNMVRIREASKLLMNSYATVEEVAYRTGYGNVSSFNRNFKKIIGMTPYQWKLSPDNHTRQKIDYKISALKGW